VFASFPPSVLRRHYQYQFAPLCSRRQRVPVFDLIELNGDDLRRDPLEVRKATLAWSNGPGVFLEDIDGISCARRGKSWRGDGQSFRSG
jgi:hypothetical protein